MKKLPPKPPAPEPVKQDPRKEFNHTAALVCVMTFLTVSFAILMTMILAVGSEVSDTNRLLATFQRMDTVKEGHVLFCSEGYLLIDGQCVTTIGKAKEKRVYTTNPPTSDDPNTCKAWQTTCDPGQPCRQTCTFDEGEALSE